MRHVFPDDSSDTPLCFAPETFTKPSCALMPSPPWEILVADDDIEVHRITRMVLADFTYENRPLKLHSVYSGKTAVEFVRNNPQTAVILLDVVMENDSAGLIAANRIRRELDNKAVRIILRTGQAGKAPEADVVCHYDINDYREKSELTSQRLRSAITTALRNFRDMLSIEREKNALRHILDTTSPLGVQEGAPAFAATVVHQVMRILKNPESEPRHLHVLFTVRDAQGTGFCSHESAPLTHPGILLPLSCQSAGNRILDLRISAFPQIRQEEGEILAIFMGHIADILDRLLDHHPRIQKETRFSHLLEHALIRSKKRESPGHLQRVGAFAHFLAQKAGLSRKDAEALQLAAPLHDIGKIAIPQDILEKKGALNPEEKAVIRTHPDIGYALLHAEDRPDLKNAAIVAREHHERWDGKGYPLGLSGEKIHVFGRITAIADVFDALVHDRSYKNAWSLPQAADFLKNKAGTLFDPALVPCFIEDMDALARIHFQWPEA